MDFVVKREPYSDTAYKAIELCMDRNIDACIAAHTITNMFYILRNQVNVEDRRRILLRLCEMFAVVGIDANKLVSALRNYSFHDFEDCLQVECAKEFKADYIITRNINDFSSSAIPSIDPAGFASLLSR
jgi:predicted nucleic acid-binding protein